MTMTFKFQLEFDDGAVLEVKAGPRDILAWEQSGGNRQVTMLMRGGGGMVDFYALAHAALRRQGMFAGQLKELQESADLQIGWDSERRAAAPADDPAGEGTDEDQGAEVVDTATPTQSAP